MRRILLGIVTCLLISGEVCAVQIHPSFMLLESITPHTAVNRLQYDTDFYTSVGGSVDFIFKNKVKLTPGFQLGLDTLGGGFDTYSNPSLILGLPAAKKVEERFKWSGLFGNAGSYHSEIFGIGTHITPNDIIEIEVTPQFFFDSIHTKQIEIDLDMDFNVTERWQINTDVAVGRTYISHLQNVTSYSGGAGATFSITKKWKLLAFAEAAHGLNTDTPYSILNSSSTVNSQAGVRPTDFGNTALDPNGNTININIGTTLDF